MSVTRSQPTLTTKPHTNSRYTHASTPPQRHLMFLAFLALHHTPNPPPTHMRTTLRICVATTLLPHTSPHPSNPISVDHPRICVSSYAYAWATHNPLL
ncbi:hypothetical protein PIB30_111239, partial [Stylosanthes scabra]|nr:hypothetical protein [Stylosanthes scabra]